MISFSEFILRYLDNWNLEAKYLAEDLCVTHSALNAWTYRGRIPNSDNIEIIEEYFGEAFKDVVFDGKRFRRKFKIIRSDGSSKVYDTMDELHLTEDVSKNSINKYCGSGDVVKQGKNKGCQFEWVYEEVE